MRAGRRKKAIAIDLFSGCGGLTTGLKRAGFDVVAAVDNDELSVKTYSANHPEVALWRGDIRKLSPLRVRRYLGIERGELDLLAGCPPCQGFSALRTWNGGRRIRDGRNNLLLDFLRFVTVLRPKAVMLENVPRLGEDRRFRAFCVRLAQMGYVGDYRVLDAADYGVPQRRKRLIYLAAQGRSVPFARPKQTRRTVRDAIGGLGRAGYSGDRLHDLPERRQPHVERLIRRIPKNGGSRTDLPKKDQLPCHQRNDGFHDIYGRMAWRDQAPTITSGCFNPSKGRFLHPTANRAITMREAALLQGFPRRYRFPTLQHKCAIALMIGNALPPPFVAAHARSIQTTLALAEE